MVPHPLQVKAEPSGSLQPEAPGYDQTKEAADTIADQAAMLEASEPGFGAGGLPASTDQEAFWWLDSNLAPEPLHAPRLMAASIVGGPLHLGKSVRSLNSSLSPLAQSNRTLPSPGNVAEGDSGRASPLYELPTFQAISSSGLSTLNVSSPHNQASALTSR